MTESGKPGRGNKAGRRPPPRPKTPEEQRAHLEFSYLANQDADIANNDRRMLEDLRMRADGSPSAVPPRPVVPLRFWAVVEAPPDGYEYESVYDRLVGYREWLRVLKRNGLYDGPTELTLVNPESREEDADADYP
jgi:hypothetical protein